MKNTYKILCSLFIVTALASCEKEEGTTYDVLDYEKGAVLRTINIENGVYNGDVPSSAFVITLEEQDEQDGALMESVDVYVSMRDLTPDNGTAVSADKFIKTIDASAFTTSDVGLPITTISTSFAESIAALGLSDDDVSPGDIFVMEFRLNLTDGRVFGKSSSTGIISGGFFSSPYAYNALISCSPEPGTYTLDMQDAYGDGWQSDGIVVSIDGVSTSYGAGSQNGGTNYTSLSVDIVVPDGTESLTWNWPGDSFPSEVTFQIYAPNGDALGIFKGADAIDNYGCGCSVLAVDGVDAVVAEPGLQPVLLCLE